MPTYFISILIMCLILGIDGQAINKWGDNMAIFCTIYYVLSYIETIPQIVKLLKTKSSNDYSLGMISLQLIALISWSLYIFTSKQSIVVYIGTIIDLVLLLFVDFLIIKYYKFNKKGVDPNEWK